MDKVYKKIGRNGNFTIPRKLREKLGMYPGTAIALDGSTGNLVIEKTVPGCILCGSVVDLIQTKTHNVCAECVKKLSKEADNT